MRLTIIETGEVPQALQGQYGPYPEMFGDMFARTGKTFAMETVRFARGEVPPDPHRLGGIVITGSSAGVYEDHAWMQPLFAFIRSAYAARTPMLGVCFGHQAMAQALGGEVRKSEKGWGLGRHTYRVVARPDFLSSAPETLSIACSHQDQVIRLPSEAEVMLRSEFTPFAGLVYKSGAAMSVQPHPEFAEPYARALVDLRRGRAPAATIDAALASFATPSDTQVLVEAIGKFFMPTARP